MAFKELAHSELLKTHAVELTKLAMEASDAPYWLDITDVVNRLLEAAEYAERAEQFEAARAAATCKWCGAGPDAPRHDFVTPGNFASAKHTFEMAEARK